ncbi:MAG: 50S ribosomal protein L17 [Bacteroidetes bacterium]|jgi:large subunit ribosomal protein L17|nr:MAG: 50S ribosomal protein L17 [Bacteroidota bacterium]
MRHGNKVNHLGRKTAHRKALLNNLACSLIEHKRIITTLAKAKELRVFVEPLITKSKNDTTHSRRIVFSYLQNKEAIKELFSTVADAIADRPGGYTRILKLGKRPGDNAELALIELVDFNEYIKDDKTRKARRTRRGKSKTKGAESVAAPVAETVVTTKPEAVVVEDEVVEDISIDLSGAEEVAAEETSAETSSESEDKPSAE